MITEVQEVVEVERKKRSNRKDQLESENIKLAAKIESNIAEIASIDAWNGKVSPELSVDPKVVTARKTKKK